MKEYETSNGDTPLEAEKGSKPFQKQQTRERGFAYDENQNKRGARDNRGNPGS